LDGHARATLDVGFLEEVGGELEISLATQLTLECPGS